MLADARLVAAKDLRLEWRSRVVTGQVLPFSVLVLILFAFAIDPGRGVLGRVAPGLLWVAVLLSTVLAAARSQAVESDDATRDLLRLSGLSPVGIFVGKASAVAVQLVVLELVLLGGVVVLYDLRLGSPVLLGATLIGATVALSASAGVYGALVSGVRGRETLLPLLLLPVVAPVLIAAASATEAAIDGVPAEGWGWAGLLGLLGVLYAVAGASTYGVLLEES